MARKQYLSSEDAEQAKVMEWAGYRMGIYPELKWLYHCPNGGSRNVIEATNLKRIGTKAGVSDLHLPYPKGKYVGLFVEMKYGRNKLSESQIEFLTDMAAAGHFCCTCYSFEDAVFVIKNYLELKKNKGMPIPNNVIIKEGVIKNNEMQKLQE